MLPEQQRIKLLRTLNINMSNNILLTKKGRTVNGTVNLTGSKSECNRALIIEALSEGKVTVQNVSDAADTVTLAGILKSKVFAADFENPITEVNIGPAGTAMRFLTAYFTL